MDVGNICRQAVFTELTTVPLIEPTRFELAALLAAHTAACEARAGRLVVIAHTPRLAVGAFVTCEEADTSNIKASVDAMGTVLYTQAPLCVHVSRLRGASAI